MQSVSEHAAWLLQNKPEEKEKLCVTIVTYVDIYRAEFPSRMAAAGHW